MSIRNLIHFDHMRGAMGHREYSVLKAVHAVIYIGYIQRETVCEKTLVNMWLQWGRVTQNVTIVVSSDVNYKS